MNLAHWLGCVAYESSDGGLCCLKGGWAVGATFGGHVTAGPMSICMHIVLSIYI